jgi:hypothetical protein
MWWLHCKAPKSFPSSAVLAQLASSPRSFFHIGDKANPSEYDIEIGAVAEAEAGAGERGLVVNALSAKRIRWLSYNGICRFHICRYSLLLTIIQRFSFGRELTPHMVLGSYPCLDSPEALVPGREIDFIPPIGSSYVFIASVTS